MDCRWADVYPDKCRELVYKRDTYRRTGRGPSGFEMHYREEQCSRKQTHGRYCWQHKKCLASGCDRRPSFNNKTHCWEHSSK